MITIDLEEKRKIYLASLRPLSRRQFKIILRENKLLDDVEAAIASIPDPEVKALVMIEWEDSWEFERLSPTLIKLYKLMGLKESQVDAMWEAGLKIKTIL